MAFKILTKNGVQNTNIDGARDHNFNAGGRSGIVQGALNECNIFTSSSNTYAIDTGELRLCGHRVVITETEYRTMLNTPSIDIRYSIVAQIIVESGTQEDYAVSFQFLLNNASTPLVQDDLDKNIVGTYQLELARFTYTTAGEIEDIVRTADLITGGSGDGQIADIEFNASAYELESNMEPEVSVDFNEETKKYDMQIGIPKGQDGLDGSGSNPNLILNSNFQVNQLGKSIYTNTLETTNKYCVDKWVLNSESTFNVLTKTFTSTNDQAFLIQYLDKIDFYNKTVSISGILDGEKLVNENIEVGDSYSQLTTIDFIENSNGRFEFCYNPNYGFFVQVRVYAGLSITIDELKLEMGSVATVYSPRPYADELSACQGTVMNNYLGLSTTYSNPNLLINGDFRVNQRGQSSYSAFGNKYCVDRWRTGGGNVTVTPMDYGCSVSVLEAGQYYSILEQIIEDSASLVGKTVTLSANIKSVSADLQSYQYCIRIRCYDTNNQIISTSESWIIDAGNYSCTITVPSNTVKVSCLLYKNALVSCTFEIEYMKLEIGSVATPYIPRPYAEELAMCQRYYQIIKVMGGYGTVSNIGVPRNTTTLRFYINLLNQIRTQPTISNTDSSIINLNTGSITQIDDNSLALQSLLTNQIVLNYATTGLTLGQIYNLTDNNGQLKIEIDAEIY